MRSTREIISCDFCPAIISSSLDCAQVMGKDCCKTCLTGLHTEVETEYKRLIQGLVPSRRGGWRALGEIDT